MKARIVMSKSVINKSPTTERPEPPPCPPAPPNREFICNIFGFNESKDSIKKTEQWQNDNKIPENE